MSKQNTTIVKMLFGSHLYGLNTPKSDKDYKGIFIPELNDLLLGTAPKTNKFSTGDDNSRNNADDIDDEMFSLNYFVQLAIKGETVSIDMLHGSEFISTSPEWKFLQENREKFYTKNMKSYIGYVTKQAAKYGIKGSKISAIEEIISIINDNDNFHNLEDIRSKLPIGEFSGFVTSNHNTLGIQEFYEVCGRKFQLTNKLDYTIDSLYKILSSYGERAKQARDNSGIDWKAISHALRVGYQARSIYKNRTFSYPLDETDFLLKVKNGELDFLTEVQPVLENLVQEVHTLASNSEYPEKVQRKFWDDWLISVYKNRYNLGD